MHCTFKNSIFIKYIWGFMSLYILNCCIDVPGAANTHEDLTINKQESLLELIIEKLLGFDNAIAEYDDTDTDSNSVKKISLDFFMSQPCAVSKKQNHIFIKRENLTAKEQDIQTPFFEITSPPPEI